MPFTFDADGHLVDADSKTPITPDDLVKIKKGYSLLDNDEATELTNKAVSGRVNELKKQHEGNTRELIAQLESLRTSASSTAEEREQFGQRINELEEQLMSAEERAEKKNKQLHLELENRLKLRERESQEWSRKYKDEYTQRRISESALKQKAINPDNFVDHLRLRETWVEIRDEDGKPTGSVEPRYKLRVAKADSDKLEEGLFDIIKAVEIVAAQNPHWIQGNGQSGSGINGNYSKPGSVSVEDIRKMTPDEVHKRFNAASRSGMPVIH